MDDLRDEFVEKQNQRVDNKSFKYLRNNGIYHLAVESFEKYAREHDVPNSRIVKNAYLIQFDRVVQEFSNSGYSLSEITKQMENIILTPVSTLQHYAGEYLENYGEHKDLSDDMYAAAIAYTAIREEEKASEYIGLIGAEAFKTAKMAERYRQRPDFFNKDYSDIKSRALHLVIITHELNSFFRSSENEVRNHRAITTDTSDFANNILGHIDAIRINEDRSSLEELITRKATVANIDLKERPIVEKDKVVSLFPPAPDYS